ncbi:hypothetical protein M0802_001314 [Mischocyttarus mexicanus]|nr:hypothetical protein M0802_001314 [Mischocyttarus mexicanus]
METSAVNGGAKRSARPVTGSVSFRKLRWRPLRDGGSQNDVGRCKNNIYKNEKAKDGRLVDGSSKRSNSNSSRQ